VRGLEPVRLDFVAIEQMLQRRRLIEPFRELVGRPENTPWQAGADRVYGRDREMETLRRHVGVLPPESFREMLARGAEAVMETFRGAEPKILAVTGLGGSGKSTLMAKFILDHAFHDGGRMPFAYLDFDRASLTGREPLSLLLWITLQVGAELPGAEQDLRALRQQIRASLDSIGRESAGLGPSGGAEAALESASGFELSRYCGAFREIVDQHAHAALPFLLIVDTFEIVEYDPLAVAGVDLLLRALIRPFGTVWPRIRIVVCGRAAIEGLNLSLTPLPVKPLALPDAEMAIASLAKDRELPLDRSQIAALARATRGRPIDITLGVRLIAETSAEERTALLASIQNEVAATEARTPAGKLQETFITGILYNRFVEHIRDLRIQKLAVPGFVVRLITPVVLRDVMAPAAARSGKPIVVAHESEWDDILDTLGRELWLVQREGRALRHRQDVREVMLPLIKAMDPDGFGRINEDAIRVFEDEIERARKEKASTEAMQSARIEAVYHCLLIGDLTKADSLWHPGIASQLSAALAELDPPAATYLKVRLGRIVSPEELRQVPPAVREEYCRNLDNDFVAREPEVALALLATVPDEEGDLQLWELSIRLLHKTGRWRELAYMPPPPAYVGHRRPTAIAGQIRRVRVATLTGRGRGLWWSAVVEPALEDETTRRALVELAYEYACRAVAESRRAVGKSGEEAMDDFVQVVQQVVPARAHGLRDPDKNAGRKALVEVLSEPRLLSVARRSGSAAEALRILAILDLRKDSPFLQLVDLSAELRNFGEIAVTVLAEELPRLQEALGRSSTGGTLSRLLSSLQSLFSRAKLSARAELATSREVAAFVEAAATGENADAKMTVRRMLASSNPEWVEPFGRALDRAFLGGVPIESRAVTLASILPEATMRQLTGATHRPDGITILTHADRSGRLVAVLGAYREAVRHARQADAEDFLDLAGTFTDWRELIDDALAHTGPGVWGNRSV
jgi:hypothetical protein